MPIIATMLLSSIFYAQTTPHGDGCQWGSSAVRVYRHANGMIQSGPCVPENYVDGNVTAPPAPPSIQNAYVIQHLENTLSSSGFRATLKPYTGKAVVVAVIASTRPQRNIIEDTSDPRHFTMFYGEDILISVSGTQLTFYYSVGGNIDPSKTFTANLAPDDIANQVLVLDTRISYNKASDPAPNLINVTVCTKRGTGGCHFYSPSKYFGSTSPDFYIGSNVSTSFSEFRARFCRLPQFGNEIFPSGYTPTCAAP